MRFHGVLQRDDGENEPYERGRRQERESCKYGQETAETARRDGPGFKRRRAGKPGRGVCANAEAAHSHTLAEGGWAGRTQVESKAGAERRGKR